MKDFIIQMMMMVRKDLISEWRSKDIFNAMFVFSILVILVFNFSFEIFMEDVKNLVSAGVLWVTFIFTGILGLNRSFGAEIDQDCLDGLIVSPGDKNAIFLGKLLVNFIFIASVEVLSLPLFLIFFNLNLFAVLPKIALVLFLGTLGFSTIGTLFSAISSNTRARDMMLPILVLPIMIPLIIASVKATSGILQVTDGGGAGLAKIAGWLKLLVATDLIYLLVALLTFEYVLED